MLLAAGRGSRLAPLTDRIPKPLLPVRGRPLIARQLEQLAAAGLNDVVINLHHLGERIAEYVDDGSRFGVTVTYSRESELLETGGGIVKALPHLGDTFIVLNGDVLTDFDFATLPRDLAPGVAAHLVVRPRPAHRDRGDFDVADGRIERRGDGWVYCGIAVLTRGLFDGAPAGAFSWTRDLLFDRLGTIEVTAQTFDGNWTDIGSPEQYESVR